MDREEVFRILGIEFTRDEGQIKDAYRKKLMKKNPEDDPEGFKNLRAAYEEALRLATSEEEEEEVDDQTPSGAFVAKAAEIYRSLSRRIDVKEWEALFRKDVFLSLEEEDNCRYKLLRFIMTHYCFPTEVWKLLDKKLNVISDTDRLKEKFPADYIGFLVNRCDQGDDLEYSSFQGADDADYDAYIRNSELAWRALSEERYEDVKEFIQKADELSIKHPSLEVCKCQLMMKTGQKEEGLAFFERLYAEYPENLLVKFHYAESLWELGVQGDADAKERSAVFFEQIKAGNNEHYMANKHLALWYYEQKRYQDAKKCAERLLAVSGSDDEVNLELLHQINRELESALEKSYAENQSLLTGLDLCWCYLQDGHPSYSMRIARELKDKVTPEKESEWKGLICKLHIELGDYEESASCALVWREALEKRLLLEEYAEERERDKDRIRQSYLIRMQCFHNLGFVDPSYFSKCIAEGEEILSGGLSDIQIRMELGQVYALMGEYEKAEAIAYDLLGTFQVSAANVILIETGRRQLNASMVVNASQQCIQDFPDYCKAYEAVAKVYLDLDYKEEFQTLLDTAKENGIESVILEAYAHQLDCPEPKLDDLSEKIDAFRKDYRKPVENGQLELYEKGLEIITGYLYDCPDDYMLVERAIYYKSAKKYSEAKADYEKALTIRSSNPYALNGLSNIYRVMGDIDKALFYLKKAILYGKDEFNPIIYTDLAEIYTQLGEYEMALESIKKFSSNVEEQPVWFVDQISDIYAKMGRADLVFDLRERAKEKHPDECFQDQIEGYVKAGQFAQAEKLLEQRAEELIKPGLLNSLKLAANSDNKGLLSYYKWYMWLYLVMGDGKQVKKALGQIKKLIASKKYEYGLAYDCIFAALCVRSKEYADFFSKRLSLALKSNEKEDKKRYFQYEKKYEVYRFFVELPKRDRKKLEELLESFESCHYCNACKEQGCVELVSAKILFLLLLGEYEEARAQYESAKFRHVGPLDWNLLALGASFFQETMGANEV